MPFSRSHACGASCRTWSASPSFSPQRSLLAIALLGMTSGAVSLAAHAQAATALSAAVDARTFTIQAGPLDVVLDSFARAAGVNLSYDATLLSGLQSKGLSGKYSIATALSLLLADSDIQAVAQAGGGYALRRVPVAQAGATLPEVTVNAAHAADGSAAQGYRSQGVSQVGPWQGRALDDLPYAITVLPAELIANLGGSSPDQLYRINPTMQFHRSQHENDQPAGYMRGFTGGGSIYRNGMPGGQYGQGTALEDTERVEVMSGLSGFLYGPGNVGGVINYVSKRPTTERLNSFTVRNNGGDNYHVHGDFGGPIDRNGRFGYRVNAAKQGGETAVDDMSISSNFMSTALDWRVTDKLLLQADFADRDYYRDGAMAYWRLASGARRPSAGDIDNTRISGQPWMRAHYENTRYGANLTWDPVAWLTVRAAWMEDDGLEASPSASNTVQVDGTYQQTLALVYGAGANDVFTDKQDSRRQVFADMRFDTGRISHQLTTGVQYSENRQWRYRNTPPELTTLTGLQVKDRPVYVQKPVLAPVDRGERYLASDVTNTTLTVGDDIRISEQWSVLAGLSRSTIKTPSYDESALTPSLSLIYKPLPAVTTYVTFMESLEQGGVAAALFNGQPVVNAGEVMKPLMSEQLEVGAKVSLGGVLLTTALFQIDKSLQFYDISNPAAPVYVQDGRQVHRGIELTAFGRVAERWSIVGGLTMLDATVREQKQNPALEGNHPTVVAERLIKLRAEYDTPWLSGVTLVGGLNYTSDRYADAANTDRLPSFTLLDVGARYTTRFAGKPVRARLEIQNLGDKRYWANGAHVGDPRMLTFSVSTDL